MPPRTDCLPVTLCLPSLGEDPEGYRQLAEEFTAQLAPRNLLERHYVEKIAAASWRLRRLHRWQAQLFEDATLTEDERLDRLDKVLRHETALHRQIDTAVKMLNKDVPQLYKSRARDQALLETMQIERECRESLESDLEVTFEARELLKQTTADPEMDYALLDAAPPVSSPTPLPLAGEGSVRSTGGGGRPRLGAENCQNETAALGSSPGLIIPGKGIILPSAPFPPREGWRASSETEIGSSPAMRLFRVCRVF